MKDASGGVFIRISYQDIYAIRYGRVVQKEHRRLRFFGSAAAVGRFNFETSHIISIGLVPRFS